MIEDFNKVTGCQDKRGGSHETYARHKDQKISDKKSFVSVGKGRWRRVPVILLSDTSVEPFAVMIKF
jgi:hypothetical protein